MKAGLSAQDLVLAGEVMSALKIGAGFNWDGAIKAFESGTAQEKIVDGAIAVDDALKIIGFFVPPVAIVANDVAVAITIEQVIYSLIKWLQSLPHPLPSPTSTPSFWDRVRRIF